MIADDRESQIVDRRKFCDRLRSYGNPLLRSFAIVSDRDRRRSQEIEPYSIFCDRLRSSAILRSYGNQSSAICDRNVSHNNFNSDSNDSLLLSNRARMFVYFPYCSVRNTKFSQQCVESPKFLSLHEYFSNSKPMFPSLLKLTMPSLQD